MSSIRLCGLAVIALAIPAIGQAQVSQAGKWSVGVAGVSPNAALFWNAGSTSAKVMVTICVDAGAINLNIPGAAQIPSGSCRTIIVNVGVQGAIGVSNPSTQSPASGTYVLSPLG
jgi:hypothetical protein